MVEFKTPAVYVQEIPGFTNSVVEVETAVPAFIGYTEFAAQGAKSLRDVPFRISSMFEYQTFFGGAPKTQFDIADQSVFDLRTANVAPTNTSSFVLTEPNTTPADVDKDSYIAHSRYYLYYALRLFFDNGGGACYIVSVGSYADQIKKDDLSTGLQLLVAEPEPTMIVVPDAMSLARQDATVLEQAILLQCSTLRSRVAILDVFAGDTKINDNKPIDKFRDGIGTVGLDYGAAYYPWIETAIVETSDIDVSFLTPKALETVVGKLNDYVHALPDAKSQAMLGKYVTDLAPALTATPAATAGAATAAAPAGAPAAPVPAAAGAPAAAPAAAAAPAPAGTVVAPAAQVPVLTPAQQLAQKQTKAQAHNTLFSTVPFYRQLMDALLDKVNLFPPSGAIAGVYARTDFTRGVFKAPAGTSIISAVRPVVAITDDDQADLNVPLDGKAVNAIRALPGSGVMVWGARTLNGNSQDTRYVNVRRTMIMLEQSIKYAAQAFMFEPNTATTWVSVESMINNFLMNQWKAGALFGATPAQAFNVAVGLGVTMTADDILNGLMNVMVKVAVVRPAEFIVLTFQQTMPSA